MDEILDAHLAVEQAGLVAVDLYDGCFLYDFKAHRMVLCDLGEYWLGPFNLEEGRTRKDQEGRRRARTSKYL
ncbi:hypothetical protein ACF1AO_16860 [Streptomyces longwoodensis]|uniref:hypothetical protein n=1 Tax=Streptomyces longwoodensis TaxID=68231 RepID=UPI003700988A